MKTIQANTKLTVWHIGDSQLHPIINVTARKGTFATIQLDGLPIRKKVYQDSDGNEFIYPYGRYSMAATARP